MKDKFLVTHQPPGGSVTDISDAVIIQEKEGIRSSADSFSFSVVGKTKYNDFFNDGDTIKIYFAVDNDAYTLIIDGFIQELDLNDDFDSKRWTISGQNRLEVLLNAPIPAVYSATGSNNNSPKAIKDIIGKATDKWRTSKYFPNITAELKSIDAVNGKIDDTTNSIINFSPPGYFRTDTPAFQMIEELSDANTIGVSPIEVGNYIYYLDSSNRFHWEPRSTTISDTIEVGDYLSAKINKTKFDVINFVIIHAGFDFNGKPIKTFAFNVTGSIKGFKGRQFVMHEIAESMKDPLSITNTTPFGNKDIAGSTDNAAFRNNVRAKAKEIGKNIATTFGQPRFKATLTLKGTTSFSKGNLYRLRIPGVFRDANDQVTGSLALRLREVTHSFNRKGWTTMLDFQQDETVLTGVAIT